MPRKQLQGFTLIELLVVVSIIVLLIAILLPSLSRARATAKTTACAANMKQIYAGMYMYAGENNGMIPPPSWYEPNPRTGNFKTWIEPIIPILRSTTNKSGTPMVFICPSQLFDTTTRSSYGLNKFLGSDTTTPSNILALKQNGMPDGVNGWFRLTAVFRPMELYLFSDVATNGSQQNYIMPNPRTDGAEFLRHPGPTGLNVAFADGHVELKPQLNDQIPYGASVPWWNRP
jgi:prepilin-type N-terminal cleavage/methylation domain-containing protein/prepilin-type processing-associated H-X9-DG protein